MTATYEELTTLAERRAHRSAPQPAEIRIDFRRQELRHRLRMLAIAVGLVLALMGILAHAAVAEETPASWRDVRTVYGACMYAKAHPGIINNWEKMKQNCV
jgi:hypothetical protein